MDYKHRFRFSSCTHALCSFNSVCPFVRPLLSVRLLQRTGSPSSPSFTWIDGIRTRTHAYLLLLFCTTLPPPPSSYSSSSSSSYAHTTKVLFTHNMFSISLYFFSSGNGCSFMHCKGLAAAVSPACARLKDVFRIGDDLCDTTFSPFVG